MTVINGPLQVPKLGKRQMSALAEKARSLGVTPERYVRLLIERDLDLDRKAREMTFAEIMAPGREVDEGELDRLVGRVRRRNLGQAMRRRRAKK